MVCDCEQVRVLCWNSARRGNKRSDKNSNNNNIGSCSYTATNNNNSSSSNNNNNNNIHSVRYCDEHNNNHQVARTNELLRMNESGVGGQPPFLMNLDDAATDVLLHFFLPGGMISLADFFVVCLNCAIDFFCRFDSRQQRTRTSPHAAHGHGHSACANPPSLLLGRYFIHFLSIKIHAVISYNPPEVSIRAHGNFRGFFRRCAVY
jgi:hypothetical protein